jgi:hypothetical protein
MHNAQIKKLDPHSAYGSSVKDSIKIGLHWFLFTIE